MELVGNIPCFCLGYVNSNAIANVLSYAIVSRKLDVCFVETTDLSDFIEDFFFRNLALITQKDIADFIEDGVDYNHGARYWGRLQFCY